MALAVISANWGTGKFTIFHIGQVEENESFAIKPTCGRAVLAVCKMIQAIDQSHLFERNEYIIVYIMGDRDDFRESALMVYY